MYPKKKTYLRGNTYQCQRTSTGSAMDRIVAHHATLTKKHSTVTPAPGGFTADGVFVPHPKKEPDVWDVIEFLHSGKFRFNGQRVDMKQITDYNPTAGTFQTGDGFFTLYPLPTA